MMDAKKIALVGVLCGAAAVLYAVEQAKGKTDVPVKQEAPKQELKDNAKENPLFFVDVKFDEFLARVVPQDKQPEFTQYYASLIKQTEGMSESDLRKVKAIYYDRAIVALQKDRPEWHKTLQIYYSNPLVTLDPKFDNVRMVVSSFLIRYGAYEDYCSRKAVQLAENNPGMWGTFKTYVSSVGNTIAGWFGFGAQEQKQVVA